MPAVNGVGEPCAGEPHARFDVAGAGAVLTCPRARESAQPSGKPAACRPSALPSKIIASPVPDPTQAVTIATIFAQRVTVRSAGQGVRGVTRRPGSARFGPSGPFGPFGVHGGDPPVE